MIDFFKNRLSEEWLRFVDKCSEIKSGKMAKSRRFFNFLILIFCSG